MRVHVKVAKTPKEIDGVFQVRHKVFIEEDGKFPAQPDNRLYDYFDTLPTTINIIAMVDDQVIGTYTFQPNGSSFSPNWIPCSSSYSFEATGPG